MCRFLYLLLLGISAGAGFVFGVSSRTLAADAPSVVGESNEAAARTMIEEEFRRNVRLHGAFVMLHPIPDSDPRRQEVTVIVDSARASTQLPEVEKLIQRLPLNPKPLRRGTYQLPVSKLLAELRERVRIRFGQSGTFVQGLYFQRGADDDVVKLMIYGRHPKGIDKGIILAECDKLLKQEPKNWKVSIFQGRAQRDLNIIPVGDAIQLRELREEGVADQSRLRREIAANSALNGTWVELVECYDHEEQFLEYDVYIVVDSAFANKQSLSLKKLFDQQLRRPYKIVESRKLPLTDLVWKTNLNFEANSKFNGCYIEYARFGQKSEQDTDASLMLYGRVDRAEQAEQIKHEICIPLMHQIPGWQPYVEEFFPNTREMSEVIISNDYAKSMFASGLAQFWQNNYDEAVKSFQYACIDAPHSIEYRYWQIVTLMKMGRNDEAYAHIEALARRGVSNDTYLRVQRSLQRVQGSLRMDIIAMENRARQELYIYQRMTSPIKIKREDTAMLRIR